MTIKEIVQQLRSEGHQVTTYQRTDVQGRRRGLIIRSIDNIHYTGSKGNEIGRAMVGARLSEYQQEAMNRLNVESKAGYKASNKPVSKRKLEAIDEAVKKKLRKIQRLYRQKGSEYGLPTLKKYRYLLKTKGEAEANRLLEQAERYARGLAYEENIEAFVLRLQQASNKLDGALDKLINAIKQYPREKFTEDKLQKLIQSYYDLLNNPNSEDKISDYVNTGLSILAS